MVEDKVVASLRWIRTKGGPSMTNPGASMPAFVKLKVALADAPNQDVTVTVNVYERPAGSRVSFKSSVGSPGF